jgi:transposase
VAISTELILNASQQDELVAIFQSRSLPAGCVFRAELILMLAEGASFRTIKHKLGTTAPTIVRWKERFLSGGIDGLDTYHPGQPPSVLTPALRARILGATRKKPADGSTHWSCRKLAAQLGVSKNVVHRVWKEAGLKPHRIERYLGKTAARHTSQEFVEFLTEVVERAPAREVHIILDNLSAHKSQVVRDFLATHLNVHFHFTPTYSSWLNQVEIWFSKVERDVIARGIFTSGFRGAHTKRKVFR